MLLIHDVLKKFKDAQFMISTHSPVLLAYPEAQILGFDGGSIREIEYEQTGSFQVAYRFLNERRQFLEELFAETPSLFGRE